jgi:hypothetical protein
VTIGENVIVGAAAYVTRVVFFRLHDFLQELGESVLYLNTKKVVNIHN